MRREHLASAADLIICDHWHYSTPLRYVFGLPAYQVSRQSTPADIEAAKKVMRYALDQATNKQNVFYVAKQAFFQPGLYLNLIAYEEAKSTFLRRLRDRLPRIEQYEYEQANIYELQSVTDEFEYPLKPYTLEIGYTAFGLERGFHKTERHQKQLYRWTNGRGKLYVPHYGTKTPTKYTLRLAAKKPNPQATDTTVQILLNDREVRQLAVENDWQEYEFTFDAPRGLPPTLKMEIVSNPWNPADDGLTGYPTNLGVAIDWIKIDPL